MTVNIFNIQHFSISDGPGIRTCVFFKGCPLNCIWCHNPESKESLHRISYEERKCAGCGKCAEVCNVHTIKKEIHSVEFDSCTGCGKCVDSCQFSALELIGKTMSENEIMNEISIDDAFFGDEGGVTFSGGEPFFQPEALIGLLKLCKERGYTTCIETSGYTAPENIKNASEYTDLFLYDYKITGGEEHKKYTGADNGIILKNLALIDELGSNVILRCPVIPDVNDNKIHFKGIAEICNRYKCITSAELLAYHPLGIHKSMQIGAKNKYNNPEFLKKEALEVYKDYIQSLCKKQIGIG